MPSSAAGSGWALDPAPAPDWQLAPRLARTLLVVVSAGLATVPFLRIMSGPDPATHRALAIGCLLAVLAVQLGGLSRPLIPGRGRTQVAALLAQTALAYLPFLEFGRSWAGVPGFLAGSSLIALPRFAGWAAFVAVVATAAAIQGAITGAPYEVAYAVAATVIGGLLIYGLIRLAALVEELRDARAEVARLAVAGERLRIARDLHDLVGSSISAITLKSELTARLIRSSPDRAHAEVTEVVDIARRALADVRSVARGYRELSVFEEALLARSMLLAADVEARIDLAGIEDLPPEVGSVFGIVIREGVTNVLRHSRATLCEIAVRRAGDSLVLEIVNDGVTGSPDKCPDSGAGLDSLSARLAALSGWLTAEALPGARWRLCATVFGSAEVTPDAGGFCDALG
jgi:two-component system, NarL family, sensor histidine kinase DesK